MTSCGPINSEVEGLGNEPFRIRAAGNFEGEADGKAVESSNCTTGSEEIVGDGKALPFSTCTSGSEEDVGDGKALGSNT